MFNKRLQKRKNCQEACVEESEDKGKGKGEGKEDNSNKVKVETPKRPKLCLTYVCEFILFIYCLLNVYSLTSTSTLQIKTRSLIL